MRKILIIEDDEDLREGLAFSLQMDGYEIRCAGTKREGLERIRGESFDLVLLDCNLPDGSGFDLCTQIGAGETIPVFMLTARNTEMDEVKALDMRLVSGGITVDRDGCRVYRKDEEVMLSRVEYQLLLYLMENRNRVLSKEQILEHVWDSQGKFVDENTLSVNIRRLRAKIEEDPGQ